MNRFVLTIAILLSTMLMFSLFKFPIPNHAYALCAATTTTSMKGTWISNDKTRNTVLQSIGSDGNIIQLAGRTHDELGRVYSYSIVGKVIGNKIQGQIYFFNMPPEVAGKHFPITLKIVWTSGPPYIRYIEKIPPHDLGDFASYRWYKECKDVILKPVTRS